jgi:hypothetical protein
MMRHIRKDGLSAPQRETVALNHDDDGAVKPPRRAAVLSVVVVRTSHHPEGVPPRCPLGTGWLLSVHHALGPWLGEAPGGAAIVAWTVGIKIEMFTSDVIADLRYAGGAFTLIFVLMWAHTSSLLVASLAYLQIVAALGVA